MALTQVLEDNDFSDIVDVQIKPLDPGADQHFPQVCPTVAKSETNCNYILDGATLCLAKHSSHWMKFMTCKYEQALRMDANEFLTEATFDSRLEVCVQDMSDYSLDELRACTYGDEAEELRATNRDYIQTLFANTKSEYGLLWAVVNGKVVTDPATENWDSRVAWKAKLVTAICDEYQGTKPAACSSMVIA